MMPLVMRLEVAASKCDQFVRHALTCKDYDNLAADWRDLFQEAARRIKELEHEVNAEGLGDW
jgi:hypothetical protein